MGDKGVGVGVALGVALGVAIGVALGVAIGGKMYAGFACVFAPKL